MNEELAREILNELRLIRAALGSQQHSSAELSENAKSAVQITVKSYEGSPIKEPCIEVVGAFATLKREVERGQMDQWQSTIDALNAA